MCEHMCLSSAGVHGDQGTVLGSSLFCHGFLELNSCLQACIAVAFAR